MCLNIFFIALLSAKLLSMTCSSQVTLFMRTLLNNQNVEEKQLSDEMLESVEHADIPSHEKEVHNRNQDRNAERDEYNKNRNRDRNVERDEYNKNRNRDRNAERDEYNKNRNRHRNVHQVAEEENDLADVILKRIDCCATKCDVRAMLKKLDRNTLRKLKQNKKIRQFFKEEDCLQKSDSEE